MELNFNDFSEEVEIIAAQNSSDETKIPDIEVTMNNILNMYPPIVFTKDPHDPTDGAAEIGLSIIDNIIVSYTEPLEDQSLRDDEIKPAILRKLKQLLKEAADQLEEQF